MGSTPKGPSRRSHEDTRYELVQHLATGGMAELYLARRGGDPASAPLVVLKRILPAHAQHRDFVSMFLDEARLASRLNHPNIARVIDVGRMEDTYCYTMEYVHGKNVREILFRAAITHQRIPLEIGAHVIASAAAGLHAAHEQRDLAGRPLEIVHRDVSPSNLMVGGDGVVKIVDFGIAKAADRMTETRSGTIKGKTAYLSPEQCRQRPVDRRSDVFSLGIVGYELLTQTRLFRHGSDFDTMDAILRGRIAPPSEVAPHLPRAIDAVLLRALARDPDERFATAAELATALGSAMGRPPPADAAKRVAHFLRALFPEEDLPVVGVASDPSLSGSLGAKTISVIPAEDSDPGKRDDRGSGERDDREPDTLDDRGPGRRDDRGPGQRDDRGPSQRDDRAPDTLDDLRPARPIAAAPAARGAVASPIRISPAPSSDVTLRPTLPLGMPQLLAARARTSARVLPLLPPAGPDPIASSPSGASVRLDAVAAGTPVRSFAADAVPGDDDTVPPAAADLFVSSVVTAVRRRDVAATLPEGMPSMLREAHRARRRGQLRRIATAVALGVTLGAALFFALRYDGAVGAVIGKPPVVVPIVVPGSGAAPDVRPVPAAVVDAAIEVVPEADAGVAPASADEERAIVREQAPPSPSPSPPSPSSSSSPSPSPPSSSPSQPPRPSRHAAAPAIDPAAAAALAAKVQTLFDKAQTALSYTYGQQALALCHEGLQLDRRHVGLITICGQASCLLGHATDAITYANRLSVDARHPITEYCATHGMRRAN